jgi:hypothetical protein
MALSNGNPGLFEIRNRFRHFDGAATKPRRVIKTLFMAER